MSCDNFGGFQRADFLDFLDTQIARARRLSGQHHTNADLAFRIRAAAMFVIAVISAISWMIYLHY